MTTERELHISKSRARRRDRGLLIDLLECSTADSQTASGRGITAECLLEVDDQQFQWVIDAGLGPLLYRTVADEIDQLMPARRDALLAANLTAIVQHGNLVEATKEIIEACEGLGILVTLLKGISISDQYYPAAHLRPMGDIDILVSESACASIESRLLDLGYLRKLNHKQRAGAHHGAPLLHPRRRTWVEIHNALFSQGTGPRGSRVFEPTHVATRLVSSEFHGRTVYRLRDELQLVYVATSLMHDLSRYGINASFVPSMLDALYLLKATKRTFDWDGLLDSLDNTMPTASLYVMLTYLSARGLYDVGRPVLSRLASLQDIVGAPELLIIHGILHTYLIGGRPSSRWFRKWHATIVLDTLLEPGSSARKLLSLPWNIAFPPLVAERYSIRFQLGRIARLLRRRA